MPDQPCSPSPALSDIALRETLDLLSRVVASMSARIDTQGERIEALATALEETRMAALTAAERTDHRAYAKLIGREVEEVLGPVLDAFADVVGNLHKEHEVTAKRLRELEQAEGAMLEQLRSEVHAVAQWRRKVPWIWLGAITLGVVAAGAVSSVF
jgi:hypothetical protein